MSSFPPPYPYFNGIDYDSSFFNQTSSGLTLSQANAKFLQKQTPDIATALETFSGGIQTNAIDAAVATTASNLFNNTSTGNIQIAQAQTTGTISIGGGNNRNGTIFIGTITKGNISIGNAMVAGTNIISIGTSSLGTVALKGTTVKLNDAGTGNIEIGNASTGTITLFKPLTVSYTYPVSAPSTIGWMQSIETGFTLTFDTSDRVNACNTTAMVQGIYLIKFFIFSPNGNIPSGENLLCVLMGSNTVKANGVLTSAGGVIDPNGGTYGWYLERKISGTTFGIDTTINFTWIINNTTAGGSQFLPYMFITAKASSGTSAGNMVSAAYTRIA